MGVVLELPAPGGQDAGEPWQISPDEALVCGQPFEGRCRGVEHGLVGGALVRTDAGAERSGTVQVRRKCDPGSCLSR